MNSYLLRRALGTISPQAVQRAETSRLLHALHAAPEIRFDGGEKSLVGGSHGLEEWDPGPGETSAETSSASADYKAHGNGVNCLVIERFQGR